ncbi:MAG TPA: glycine betaine ABC transporter substrate-binding protein [Armatimonadota bacterium]|jgi:osmoprotectant transport system permease protein
MMLRMVQWLVIAALLGSSVHARPAVTIGSKAFAESWVLGDALAALVRQTGRADVEHRKNLGGTEIVYQALQSGGIDVYPEYTGTIAEVLMKSSGRPSLAEMRAFLKPRGIGISDPLGFNDGYALAVMPATQKRYGLTKLSDLARHPDLRLALSHEFIGRKDGYPGLARAYGLRMTDVRGIQHDLAYGALASGQADVMDVYTTDAQIAKLGLKVLEDDRGFFPRYDAVLLYRLDLPRRAPEAFAAMQRLSGRVNEAAMIRANAMVVLQKKPSEQAAAALLRDALGAGQDAGSAQAPSALQVIPWNVLTHMELVVVSLLAAIVVGVPLGILAASSRLMANLTLSVTGLLQTIPSLALLALLIAVFHRIGLVPSLVALFLYSLLPIVRNTYTGLANIPPTLSEAAEALGLPRMAQLLRVRLPMASPSIAAGIKTSAVINVGTATLAALIGAGGLGNPILQGIALRDNALILQGAIPVAVLALLVQGGFDLLDRVWIPRGLRLRG